MKKQADKGKKKFLLLALKKLEKGGSLLVVFGPEGGLTEQEVGKLIGKWILLHVRLGPRILRTETAPLICIIRNFLSI